LDGLARLSSRYTHEVALTGGYAFLVEKELNYQIRINDPLAKRSVPQPKAVRVTDETSTTLKTFRHEMLSWRMEHDCNLDARALFDEKFPGILNPLKHAKVGTFTSVITAREAFDYVEKAIGSTAISKKKCLDHLAAILKRKYIPEQSGAKIYFTLCETNMYQVVGTGVTYIPKSTLMAATQQAFTQTINKDKVQQINGSWDVIRDEHLLLKTSTDTIYNLFKEHYTKHLKDWFRTNMLEPEPTTGKAHVLVEHTNILADLQETLQTVVANQNHFQEQYATQSDAEYNAYAPPIVVTVPTSVTASNNANSVAPSTVYPDFDGILQGALQAQAAVTEKANTNVPKQSTTTRPTQRNN